MKEIKNIRVGQSSRVIAATVFLLCVAVIIVLAIYLVFCGLLTGEWILLRNLLASIFGMGVYVIGINIMMAILFSFYNLAARLVGGIKIEVE